MEKIEAKDVNFYYGDFHALKGISMNIPQNKVVAFIGPSGCGKSTFLRLFNRMNDLVPGARLEGQILIDGQDIYGKGWYSSVRIRSRKALLTTSHTDCA